MDVNVDVDLVVENSFPTYFKRFELVLSSSEIKSRFRIQVRLGQVRIIQGKSSQERSGQSRSGQVNPGQVR